MSNAKVAITMDEDLLEELDILVSKGFFSNRSQAISSSVREKVSTIHKSRLLRELSKINKKEEQALADEFLYGEKSWPEY